MRLKKRTLVLLGVMVVAVAASIGAYAYFTATGSGSGTGTVGTSTPWLVNGGSVVGTLYPDASFAGPDQGVVTGASVTNNAASGHQNLNKIIATISGVTSAAGGTAACAVTDFQFNSPSVATWTPNGTQTATILPNVNLAPGGVYNISNLNVVMVDNLGNQDRCKGQTVTVTFDAS